MELRAVDLAKEMFKTRDINNYKVKIDLLVEPHDSTYTTTDLHVVIDKKNKYVVITNID